MTSTSDHEKASTFCVVYDSEKITSSDTPKASTSAALKASDSDTMSIDDSEKASTSAALKTSDSEKLSTKEMTSDEILPRVVH